MGKLMTAVEAANFLKIGIRTFRRWHKEGRIEGGRVEGCRKFLFDEDQLRAKIVPEVRAPLAPEKIVEKK